MSALSATWRDRWDGGVDGTVVLDLGAQPAGDLFPASDAPLPDPVHPLRMMFGANSQLAQLEFDPTTPDEVRGVEPQALVDQARAAVRFAHERGLTTPGGRAVEFTSPHGGSWAEHLADVGMRLAPAADEADPPDLVVDCFSLMHEPDQRAAFARRAALLGESTVLLVQFHSLAAIMRDEMWNALRHGHFAYYSTPAIVAMAAEFGLTPVAAQEFDLYGGTVLLAFRRGDHPVGDDVAALIAQERAAGVLDAHRVAGLQNAVSRSTRALRSWLDETRAAGLSVAGYGAASRTAALLDLAEVTSGDVRFVADASSAKHGLTLPVTRIPIVSPEQLVAAAPDRVVLFVPDLLDEVRRALPEIESSGGRWVLADPVPRVIDPLTRAVSP